MYEYCTVPELLVLVPYYLEIVLSTVRHACECRYSYSYVHHAGMLHTSTSTVLCCIRVLVLMPGSFLRFATLCNSTISARCPIKQNSFAKDYKFCQPGGPLDTCTRRAVYAVVICHDVRNTDLRHKLQKLNSWQLIICLSGKFQVF